MNRLSTLIYIPAALAITTAGFICIPMIGPATAGVPGPGSGGGAAPPVSSPPSAPASSAPASAAAAFAAPASTGNGLTTVYQGLPMPTSGSCADVQDVDYGWGTGLIGGWHKAWEPWARTTDTVDGGWACTRSLVYSGDTWTTRP